MKHRMRQIFAGVLCLLAAANPLIPAARAAEAEDTIYIRSLADWTQFARQCRLDTWSQGKTVVLQRDLTLTGDEIVPTFGGVFEGDGHTISNLALTGEGSCQGLFRYVQPGARISDLTVAGRVSPDGDCQRVGGIAGVNAGAIIRCRFQGAVCGTGGVGGIAGVNEAGGEIANCSAAGAVTGEHYTGGIAGENYGVIDACANDARVNTQEAEVSPDLSGLDLAQLNTPENVPACTDTGGIAGYSKGTLRDCTNRGAVGYPHTGYNIGGIVGRQSGCVDGCVNYGAVQGRKDVGGVVGQMEPYIQLQYQEDTLQKLERELDTLDTLLNRTLDSAQRSSHSLTDQIDAVTRLADTARMDVSGLADYLEQWGSGTVDTANEFSARLGRTLDQAVPVAEELEFSVEQIAQGIRALEGALDTLEGAGDSGALASAQVRRALTNLSQAIDAMDEAQKGLSQALRLIPDSFDNDMELADALEELPRSLTNLKTAVAQARQAVADLIAALPDGELRQALSTVLDRFDAVGLAIQRALDAIPAVCDALRAHRGEPRQALDLLLDALDDLSGSGDSLKRSITRIQDAMLSLDEVRDIALDSGEELQAAFHILAGGADSMDLAFGQMRSILSQLAQDPALSFPGLDSGFYEQEDHLNRTLSDLTGAAGGINRTARQTGDNLNANLRAVNDQLTVISNLLQDARADPEEDYVVDTSQEEAGSEAGWGWVAASSNRGSVAGDVNVGGITGAMAVEYDFDPEDDVTSQGRASARFQYRTRAVLRDCVNYGPVTARKDCVGGAAGRMDLGLIQRCGNAGPVETTAGQYAGGVAGASYAAIQASWAKCTLTGERHVGGIAGLGADISQCRALVALEGGLSNLGAIAGEVQEEGELWDNWFVSDTLGGVDGISYAGKAQNLDYEAFIQLDGLPYPFRTFTLTFQAEDKIISQREFDYGAALEESWLPEVPEKEGFYGQWTLPAQPQLFFDTVIQARYTPWRTALSDGSGAVLAEGCFGPDAALSTVQPLSQPMEAAVGHWRITLSEGEFTALRLARPEEATRPAVWVRTTQGEWEALPHTVDGSYLRVSLSGREAELCLTQLPPDPTPWIALAAGGAAVLLILRSGLRRRKKKKTLKQPVKA